MFTSNHTATWETIAQLATDKNDPKFIADACRVLLSEFYSYDEVTNASAIDELTPVINEDGRNIGNGKRGFIAKRL